MRALVAGGGEATLPREQFVPLARAMVPRGMVDTELAEDSIDGALRLVVEHRDAARIEGRVEGTFALVPTSKREVAKRENAACLFTSKGSLRGRFAIDARTGRLVALRAEWIESAL